MKFLKFFLLLWVIFALLDPDPNTDPDPLTRLNPDPVRIRICNPGCNVAWAVKLGPQSRWYIIQRSQNLQHPPPPPLLAKELLRDSLLEED